MTYPEPSAVNFSEGVQALPIYANLVTNNLFIFMALATFWVIICVGTYMTVKGRAEGEGNFMASLSVSSYVTFIVTVVLSLVEGLVPIMALVISFALCIVSTLFFFLFQKEG